MATKYISFKIIILMFLLGCSSGFDEYYTYHKSIQVVKFKDSNKLITFIEYPEAGIKDSLNQKIASLRISPTEPTKFIVKSDNSSDTFEITMVFGPLTKVAGNNSNYERKLENVMLTLSSRPNAKLLRYTLRSSGTWTFSTNYYLIDSLIIE